MCEIEKPVNRNASRGLPPPTDQEGPLLARSRNVLIGHLQEAPRLPASSHVGASLKPEEGLLRSCDQHLTSLPRHFKRKKFKGSEILIWVLRSGYEASQSW